MVDSMHARIAKILGDRLSYDPNTYEPAVAADEVLQVLAHPTSAMREAMEAQGVSQAAWEAIIDAAREERPA